ncbi:hypothetical protein V496_00112 [Pseudogymnoascus sp. VKM F-4515 (FW-2607)]|nr:hypothetical protein V496_00112 [Pseudogymnoascus sp. VKM F-4515 (FW-2607)]
MATLFSLSTKQSMIKPSTPSHLEVVFFDSRNPLVPQPALDSATISLTPLRAITPYRVSLPAQLSHAQD